MLVLLSAVSNSARSLLVSSAGQCFKLPEIADLTFSSNNEKPLVEIDIQISCRLWGKGR